MTSYYLSHESQLCVELLKEYYGPVIAQVGQYLLRRGNRTCFDIKLSTGLSMDEVRKCLAVMIQHNLVNFRASERSANIVEYSAVPHNIYCLLRYPKYLYTIKRIFGDTEEMFLEVLLHHGKMSASNLIFEAANNLRETRGESVLPSLLYDKLVLLAAEGYIIRCPNVVTVERQQVPTLQEVDPNSAHYVPKLDLSLIAVKLKENATQLGEFSDSHMIWRANFDRFDTELRHVILINVAARRVDTVAGELFHTLLLLWNRNTQLNAPCTNAVTYNEIKDTIRKRSDCSPTLFPHLDQYLKLLKEDSSELLTKVGEAGGGQYVLNYERVFENLAWATLDSIVLEKLGSKALRLFRVTREKRNVEHDPMHAESMIHPKDVKLYSYKLLEHNYLQMENLSKSSSTSAPVKSFVLFRVDLPMVVRKALSDTYKGIYNALVRKAKIEADNFSLENKLEGMESCVKFMRLQGIPEDEITEFESTVMSDVEKAALAKAHTMADQITLAKCQVDDTILILESYLKYWAPNFPMSEKEKKAKAKKDGVAA